ncbi:MAG: MBL fold metallo-hydrolase [Acidobacteriota bacterium]
MDTLSIFPTGDGRSVCALPVEAFPGFVANVYLILGGPVPVLVDCGSGTPECRQQIEGRFEELRDLIPNAPRLRDVGLALVTHGHIDHFGGLPWIREITSAPSAVHALDRRVLSNYEERVVVASKHVELYLESCGVSEATRRGLMELYLFAKGRYRSTPVDLEIVPGEATGELAELAGPCEALHVPGHCPGQVALRFGSVLLTADHVLSRTTPNQAPETITQWTGLGHYFLALDEIAAFATDREIQIGLGGHEDAMEDVVSRVQKIRSLHQRRLQRVLDIADEPRSVREISQRLFGPRRSYHVLLALCETGAHVEYLYQRGDLSVSNLDEVEKQHNPVLRYRRT